jgi:hypothetical protein
MTDHAEEAVFLLAQCHGPDDAWRATAALAHAMLAGPRLVLLPVLRCVESQPHPTIPGERVLTLAIQDLVVNPATVAAVRSAGDHDGEPTSFLSFCDGSHEEYRIPGPVDRVLALLNGDPR